MLVAHYASRIVEISACFVLAMVASRRAVNERALYATGVVAAGLGLVFEHLLGAAWNGVSAEGLLLGALTGIFTGWSLACGMMLFARVFCAFSPHVAMIAIPLSYAGSHLLFLASLALGNAPSLVFKVVLVAVAFAGLAYLMRACLHMPVLGRQVPGSLRGLSFRVLLGQGRWRSLLFGALVFPLFYGLTAQICDAAQVSNGLFDNATEVVGIVLLLVFAASGVRRRRVPEPEAVFAVLLPVFATAMLLLPLFWGNEVFVAGFVMKCGFLIYTSLMWVCLCEAVRRQPHAAYFYFGVTIGVYHLAIMVGRLVAQILQAYASLSGATVAFVSLLALWLLLLVSLTLLFMRRRTGQREAGRDGISPDDAFDEFVRRYGLSEREAAVCREFARGRTVDYIAGQLVVSPETVKTHIKRAYGKTGCHSRQDLIDKIEQTPGTLP